MSKIRQLPDTLVSQIKAGEVVERPASALKELIDNAIDSGASSIKVNIEKGGLSLIQVEDDGEGIFETDLPLAFARHATSKIHTFEDLSHALTMGFRGEALASIASVSRCKIISARSNSPAFEIEAEEGRVHPVQHSNRQQGTTTIVRDLFFYVPARRKFLKSEPTEANYCRDAFSRAAMSRPDIAMSFSKDGKIVYRLPPQTALERAKTLLGNTLSGEIAVVEAEYPPYRITGFASPVGALPSGRETQMLFVNHRFARDKLLMHAAKEALIQSRGLGREREVAFVLFLELPPELVDANAHPAKTEVRFKDPRAAHQFVYKALSDALSKLPAASPDPAAHAPRPLASREPEQNIFGEPSEHAQPHQVMEVANEAERFLGPLRSGYCVWDAGDGLWIAPFSSLATVRSALDLAAMAESGELSGREQLIAPLAQGLSERKSILMSRVNQVQALGLDLEWIDSDSCHVSFAPEGFDNCDWSTSLNELGARLSESKRDALTLCHALCSGLPVPALGQDELWEAASTWMDERRLARELPGARMITLGLS